MLIKNHSLTSETYKTQPVFLKNPFLKMGRKITISEQKHQLHKNQWNNLVKKMFNVPLLTIDFLNWYFKIFTLM